MAMKSFLKKKISKNIILLWYQDKKVMLDAVMRIHLEGDMIEFRKEGFTHKEFKRLYRDIYGRFNYYTQWNGFTVPSEVFEPFIKGKRHPLSKEEKELIEDIRKIRSKHYSIIFASSDTDIPVLNHEIAHCLFDYNLEYREEVLKEIRKFDLNPIFKILKKNGYTEDVFEEEAHCFIMNNLADLKNQNVNINYYFELSGKLGFLFNKHSI